MAICNRCKSLTPTRVPQLQFDSIAVLQLELLLGKLNPTCWAGIIRILIVYVSLQEIGFPNVALSDDDNLVEVVIRVNVFDLWGVHSNRGS